LYGFGNRLRIGACLTIGTHGTVPQDENNRIPFCCAGSYTTRFRTAFPNIILHYACFIL